MLKIIVTITYVSHMWLHLTTIFFILFLLISPLVLCLIGVVYVIPSLWDYGPMVGQTFLQDKFTLINLGFFKFKATL